MLRRDSFFLEAMSHEKAPYVWGAKGPNSFDCSGFVTYCMRAAGLTDDEAALLFGVPAHVKPEKWQDFTSAAKMFAVLESTDAPKPGDLAFYGSPRNVTHVMICMGDGRVVGASGGGSQTTAPTPGACVKFKSSALYRPDFRGYRSLPCP